MKITNIKVIYEVEDRYNNKRELFAEINGEGSWEQYGGTREELAEIMPLTEAIANAVSNEYFADSEANND